MPKQAVLFLNVPQVFLLFPLVDTLMHNALFLSFLQNMLYPLMLTTYFDSNRKVIAIHMYLSPASCIHLSPLLPIMWSKSCRFITISAIFFNSGLSLRPTIAAIPLNAIGAYVSELNSENPNLCQKNFIIKFL